MKLQICAEIEGTFLLKERIEAKLYPYTFEIFSNNGNYFISVTKPVKDYMDSAPKLYMKNGMVNMEATKPDIYQDMEEWLYYIEAMGAFNFEVSKIHTDELEVRWIYETEDEIGTIPVTSLKRNKQKREPNKYLKSSNLSNLVIFRKVLPEAHIPFNFYRQGKTFFENDNYYFAFINYYMMLEFCFADGKFKKEQVTPKFLSSKLLKLCILSSLTLIKNYGKNDNNYKWLVDECTTRHKKVNFEGVVYLLIEYRGLLSHATKRSEKYFFDNYKLRPLAFIISMICFTLCGYIQVYSLSSEESKQRLMQERISALELELAENEESE